MECRHDGFTDGHPQFRALLFSRQHLRAFPYRVDSDDRRVCNGPLMRILKLKQSNVSLQVVLAEQLTAANPWQRNTAAEAISIQSQSISSRASAPTDYSNTSTPSTDY